MFAILKKSKNITTNIVCFFTAHIKGLLYSVVMEYAWNDQGLMNYRTFVAQKLWYIMQTTGFIWIYGLEDLHLTVIFLQEWY